MLLEETFDSPEQAIFQRLSIIENYRGGRWDLLPVVSGDISRDPLFSTESRLKP